MGLGLHAFAGCPQANAHGGCPHAGLAANAGVLMLVRTGAVQAMAMPAPIRLSTFRREIPSAAVSLKFSGVISSPPLEIPESFSLSAAFHDSSGRTSIGGGDFSPAYRRRAIRMA
jgi:hypothetical protein